MKKEENWSQEKQVAGVAEFLNAIDEYSEEERHLISDAPKEIEESLDRSVRIPNFAPTPEGVREFANQRANKQDVQTNLRKSAGSIIDGSSKG